MSPTLLELQIMEIADLGIMEIDNFKKKLWKSTTSGKNWGNRQQQKGKLWNSNTALFLLSFFFTLPQYIKENGVKKLSLVFCPLIRVKHSKMREKHLNGFSHSFR